MAGALNRYIILPKTFDWRRESRSSCARAFSALHAAATKGTSFRRALGLPRDLTVNVLDSIRAHGPKLVELPPEQAGRFRVARPDLQLERQVFFPARDGGAAARQERPRLRAIGVVLKIHVTVTAAGTGAPIEGARIVAFVNFAAGDGEEQTTDANGQATFSSGGASKKLERLYIFPVRDFWPRLDQAATLKNGAKIELLPIDLSVPDGLRHFYPATPLTAGDGVRVGVIDAGIAPHADLRVEKAVSAVTGDAPEDAADVSPEGHGTHVSGIIAARGTPPAGVRGIAPGASLFVYRVVPRGSDKASNFAIAKAIDLAVSDRCDLINMSIAGADPDPLVRQAIMRARQAGACVVAASGNDGRQPVSFPASDSQAFSVSAFGRKGTFPTDTTQALTVVAPFGADPDNYIADFSNIGEETDFTAPGVGIVSTVSGGHAVLDGTSMACPAVTGAGASMLAANTAVLSMTRSDARSEAIAKMLFAAAKTLGFAPEFEGQGLIRA